MSLEDDKRSAIRFQEEVFNEGRLELVDELLSPDYVEHAVMPPGMTPDRNGVKQQVEMYRRAFPDGRVTVEDTIAEGDMVVVRWSGVGTHQADLFGAPATGRRVTVTGIDINRMKDGRIVEHWGEVDLAGMLQQVGAMPMPAAAGAT